MNDWGNVPNFDNLPGIPARITAQHKERYEIVCEHGMTYAPPEAGVEQERCEIHQTAQEGELVMEIWDAYLPDGTLAGRDLVRGQPIPVGLRHLVAEVLVRHTDGDYLLMQRDPRKPNYGGYFEATAGGSALKGEDATACAQRELREETGILSGNVTHIGHSVSYNTIYENYLWITDCDKASIQMQEGETVSCKWISEEEFIAFVNSDAMIDTQFQRLRPYFEKMGYLR